MEDVQIGLKNSDSAYQLKSQELANLTDLSNTIKTSGIINPIVVYKFGEKYRVVAGERRTLAAILAKKNEIEARVYNEKPTGFALKLVQWIENTAREDLSLQERMDNISEVIKAFQQEKRKIITPNILQEITGLSLAQISCYLSVISAPSDVKEKIKNGMVSNLDKAAFIAKIDSPELRKQALDACIAGFSLKKLKQLIAQSKLKSAINERVLKSKPGPAARRVNLGSSKKISVVKEIIKAIISTAKYQQHQILFTETDWNSYDSASKAFFKLIQILEIET
jgi:ParB family chromosome partitioning protein